MGNIFEKYENKIKISLLILIILVLTAGCTKPEDPDINSYKAQINELNEEVINYLDELEDKGKIIIELEQTIEENSSIIKELKNEVEILKEKITKFTSDEITLESNEIETEKTEEIVNKFEDTIEKIESDSKIEKETEVINDSERIENDLTRVIFEKIKFGILDEENVIPLKKIGFNNILEENILSPLKGNQYSYHKKISRDGIVIDMYSKDDKKYIIKGIFLESPEFKLESGFGVGADKDELEGYVEVNGIELKSYNDGIYESYSYSINESTFIYFEIEKNIISSIKIECNY